MSTQTAAAAADQTDSTEEYHYKPVPLRARLGFKEPALVWSGFGIAYICAVIGGLIYFSPFVYASMTKTGAFGASGLKAGRTQIHGLLLDPPEYVQTAKVFDLLLAVPKYGRVKVNRILTHCRISPSKTIGGLSERQRNELVSYLRR